MLLVFLCVVFMSVCVGVWGVGCESLCIFVTFIKRMVGWYHPNSNDCTCLFPYYMLIYLFTLMRS